ncbi:MAG TPA: aminomethyl-transferring glycine dehydrogenase subunit GcvPA [Candidatus Omnitrophota bacterium]|nr:aminomethyl-transferring glycine dehydrogenase subunit GcvPA [Candidatus Omnitrophota bacterium]HPT07137.1 aminomethyl-transferring glycine dehydrogenase subunit GcvPA [Candidatus Omnitrophota bacterium]
MGFTPHTDAEIKEMLASIGVTSIDGLFKDIAPDLRAKSFAVPEGKSEFEVVEHFKKLAAKNATGLTNFVGAGFYDHYIPAAVDALAARSEFYTAYTPYQPECSQGWLQAVYEYQTAMCQLTGLDAANASLYDGGTALYEAAMMAIRITGRRKIIMDSGVNLIYRTMLYTYTSNLSIEFVETPVVHGQSSREAIYKHLDENTAAIIVQNPNFFGAVDDFSDISKKAHAHGALVIGSVYPVSLGMLKTPAEMDIDIATGEGQSLGLPLYFGGPYLGFMATKMAFVRKMPGRIVGATVDKDNKRGFVLTLQAREQHIRREKATSNICSNEALCALRSLLYLSLVGKAGFRELAEINFQKSEYLKNLLDKVPGVSVKRSSPTFNEFTVLLPKNSDEVAHAMIEKGFACGFPLGRFYKGMDNYLLVAATEKRTKEEMMKFADSLEVVLCS